MINFSIFAIQNVCIKSPDRIKSSKRNMYNTSLCILRLYSIVFAYPTIQRDLTIRSNILRKTDSIDSQFSLQELHDNGNILVIYLLLEHLYVQQIKRLIIIIQPITKSSGRRRKNCTEKSVSHRMFHTYHIYNPIAIIVQYDIFLKYCQRGFFVSFL